MTTEPTLAAILQEIACAGASPAAEAPAGPR